MDFTMLPGVPVAVPLVFTTFGWMHASQVELRRVVCAENDDHRIVRTDKFTLDGQWCGNDLTVDLKRWPEGMAVPLLAGQVGG